MAPVASVVASTTPAPSVGSAAPTRAGRLEAFAREKIAEARTASPTLAVAADGTLYVGFIGEGVQIFAYRAGRFRRQPALDVGFKPDFIKLESTQQQGLLVEAERRDDRDSLPRGWQTYGDLPHALRVLKGDGWQPVAGATDAKYAYGSDGKQLLRAFTDSSKCDENVERMDYHCTVAVDIGGPTGWSPLPQFELPSPDQLSLGIVLNIGFAGDAPFVQSNTATAVWSGKRWSILGGLHYTTSLGFLRTRLSSAQLAAVPKFSVERWDPRLSSWHEVAHSGFDLKLLEARREPLSAIAFARSATQQVIVEDLRSKNALLASVSGAALTTPAPPPHGNVALGAVWKDGKPVVLSVTYRAAEFGNGKVLVEPHVWEWDGQTWQELGPWDP